jgi:hypothetical protein
MWGCNPRKSIGRSNNRSNSRGAAIRNPNKIVASKPKKDDADMILSLLNEEETE